MCRQAPEPMSGDCGSLCALEPVLHSSRGHRHEKATPGITEWPPLPREGLGTAYMYEYIIYITYILLRAFVKTVS